MVDNFLQLNRDKTEVSVIGPEGDREKLLLKLQHLKPSESINNLGDIFDSELNFITHVRNTTKIVLSSKVNHKSPPVSLKPTQRSKCMLLSLVI